MSDSFTNNDVNDFLMKAPHLDLVVAKAWKSVRVEEYEERYRGCFRVKRGAVDFEVSSSVVDNPTSNTDFFEAKAAMNAVNEELDMWKLNSDYRHVSSVSIILHEGDEQTYSGGMNRYHIYCDIRKSPEEIKKYLRSQREIALRFIRARK